MPAELLAIMLETNRRAEIVRLAEARGGERDAVIDDVQVERLKRQAWQPRETENGLAGAVPGGFAAAALIKAGYCNIHERYFRV